MFVQFDIKDFREMSIKDIETANLHTNIYDGHLDIIKHCRRSIKFYEEVSWMKNG